jgi:hypothetical protein
MKGRRGRNSAMINIDPVENIQFMKFFYGQGQKGGGMSKNNREKRKKK